MRVHYLDNNATTRVAPEVVAAMMPFLTDAWGNPSSAYAFGRQVRQSLERAREQVAALIRADPREVVFTSCGTESNNAAIHSALVTQPGKRQIVTTAVEHSAVLKHVEFLKRQGYEVTLLPVEPDGSLDVHLLEQSIGAETAVVSVMWANNETGVVFPIEEVAAICRSKGVLFHTDAVQAPGKLAIDVRSTGVDYLSLSAHKLHAPKGIGLLYTRQGAPFHPYLIGGHQEHGRRGGTENVPYIIGFGCAAALAPLRLAEENGRVRGLRDRLEEAVLRDIPRTSRNGAREPRLPNTSSLSFEGVEAESMLMLLDQAGICASSGSACTTGSLQPSHVLTAMGMPPTVAKGSVRFSLSTDTTGEDIEHLLAVLPGIIEKLRAASPGGSAAPGAPQQTRVSALVPEEV